MRPPKIPLAQGRADASDALDYLTHRLNRIVGYQLKQAEPNLQPGIAVVIRPAREADAAAVSRCVSRAYSFYIDRIGKAPGPMLVDYQQIIRQHEVHVAESADASPPVLLGVLVLIISPDQFLLDNIAVAPAFQGVGIGSKLVAVAERRARECGYPRIELYTHELMIENLEMYPKLGYSEYRRVTESGYKRVYFEKFID